MFELGGKCLAFHGPLLYEAKILKIWDPATKTVTSIKNSSSSGKSTGSNSNDKSLLQNTSATAPTTGTAPTDQESIPAEIIAFPCYFIHYQGWKSTWDEWISSIRIREYNVENLELKKKLVNDAREAKKLKDQERKKKHQNALHPSSSTSSLSASSRLKKVNDITNKSNGLNKPSHNNGPSSSYQLQNNIQNDLHNQGQSNRRGSSISPQRGGAGGGGMPPHSSSSPALGSSSSNSSSSSSASHYQQQLLSQLHSNNTLFPRITLHIPLKLKSILVDDWECITKEKKIINLPCQNNVSKILEDYEHDMLKSDSSSPASSSIVYQSQLNEFIQGLKLYFNETLSRLLLYRLERLQYEELLIDYRKKHDGNESHMNVSEIYGAMHLLRLISILPELISSTTMDNQSCQLIVKQAENLSIWMVLHIDKLFSSNNDSDYYINTSSQYEGVALNT
ncbi:Eaf3p NDAI_0H01960 [Naumovozyma dairenensis CBS 421]|uniref:Chromatin modification-related protein EAF3 n=1 Tax=Naumovozyma dairenensis (strain ATCC 10597 / BCRC 20456 / CBS 421 / NBRC 0211 / NRRL Y-12639) TaxID=1071378 RepID=G0WF09_NAUDC|nr:hypothetical protein NDAI_0H01960 [Naumovozyma dairenensis CBS 421]CCD26370.1 hypothetical protein NDAI_0H01960 [Naumovozyma dairenensis CBS 421]